MKKIIALVSLILVVALTPMAMADDGASKEGKKYTECAAIRMKEISLKSIEEGGKNVTKVPDGWTVVGGTGGEGHPKLLLCR